MPFSPSSALASSWRRVLFAYAVSGCVFVAFGLLAALLWMQGFRAAWLRPSLLVVAVIAGQVLYRLVSRPAVVRPTLTVISFFDVEIVECKVSPVRGTINPLISAPPISTQGIAIDSSRTKHSSPQLHVGTLAVR
jgi:hypothetical protein